MPIMSATSSASAPGQARDIPGEALVGAKGGCMEPMSVLLTLWAVLTTVLVIMLIYRSALSMHEDDQIFLDSAESHLENEQKQLMLRMNRVRPFINILGACSGLLLLLMAGLWVWRIWSRM